jgi:hypothetical protein
VHSSSAWLRSMTVRAAVMRISSLPQAPKQGHHSNPHNAPAMERGAPPAPQESAAAEHDRRRQVAGVVRLVTDTPIQVPRDGGGDLRQRVAYVLNRRPWVVPAVLIGACVLVLLVRRR